MNGDVNTDSWTGRDLIQHELAVESEFKERYAYTTFVTLEAGTGYRCAATPIMTSGPTTAFGDATDRSVQPTAFRSLERLCRLLPYWSAVWTVTFITLDLHF
jgi:hypothetical protein